MHTPLPRPPSGTVCGVDMGNGGDLEDEGVDTGGKQINENTVYGFVRKEIA